MFDLSKEKASPGLEEFVLEFYEDRIAELSEMHKFLANHDFSSVQVLAHKWRGFSKPYGFDYLESLSISLEVSSKGEDLHQSNSLLEKISEYLEQKREFLGLKE